MITLRGRSIEFNSAAKALGPVTIRISREPQRPRAMAAREAFLISSDHIPLGFKYYLAPSDWEGVLPTAAPSALLAAEFDYLDDGDVIALEPGAGVIRTLFRKKVAYNSFLLTERCNNYCLMCSQPPRDVSDGWIAEEILAALPLIDRAAAEICFSGGEPTLLGPKFLELVRSAKSYLPNTALHILSNGRSFAQESMARDLANIQHPDMMLGIPIYADLAHVHDYIVQSDGAFDETIRGILNLKRHGVRVEIRVVLEQPTIPRLTALAHFLARNLLFVDHVALMGLEITGFTRANLEQLWIDPVDYQKELLQSVGILDRSGMRVSIYNSQLCVLDPSLHRFARRSISDWKQEYMPECHGCTLQAQCGGFFSSARLRYSRAIRAVEPHPENAPL
ncbi:His-Xaa-Ser system radical SAM maturase HxsC [Novosphingobium sp.]|uniref:His-Xaa-Ser system radical SAM maturase HxsC n=1 Tax=Novosphingobium sp. TaxID=1874826 RepID=UPI0038BCF074